MKGISHGLGKTLDLKSIWLSGKLSCVAEAYSLRNRSRSSSNLKSDILTSFLYPFKDVASNNHEIMKVFWILMLFRFRYLQRMSVCDWTRLRRIRINVDDQRIGGKVEHSLLAFGAGTPNPAPAVTLRRKLGTQKPGLPNFFRAEKSYWLLSIEPFRKMNNLLQTCARIVTSGVV